MFLVGLLSRAARTVSSSCFGRNFSSTSMNRSTNAKGAGAEATEDSSKLRPSRARSAGERFRRSWHEARYGPSDTYSFEQLRLRGPILSAVRAAQYSQPTVVQKQTIPPLLRGKSAVVSAQTGTGKTAAYALPLLQRLLMQMDGSFMSTSDVPVEADGLPKLLVICPTRELAEQAHEMIERFLVQTPFKLGLVYGGGSVPKEKQAAQLRASGADVLVATPGRLLELTRADLTDLSHTRMFVMDECDKMLELGFLPDMLELWKFLPKPKEKRKGIQVVLLSATVGDATRKLARRFASQPVTIDLNSKLIVPRSVKQFYYTVSHRRKTALLSYLLRRRGSIRGCQVLAFTRTNQRADNLACRLTDAGFPSQSIHGNMTPARRAQLIKAFRDGVFQCLVATNVMSRGMDVPLLPVVVNYDLPEVPEDYIHRIGRTGRADAPGVAISLVDRHPHIMTLAKRPVEIDESRYMKLIEARLSQRIEHRKIPGSWDDSDIPEETEVYKRSQLLARELIDSGKSRTPTPGRLRRLMRRQQQRDSVHGKYGSVAPNAPRLRDFAQGRFEAATQKLNARNAARRGVLPRDTRSIAAKRNKRRNANKRARKVQSQTTKKSQHS
eukprot:gnl/Spiro4/13987_TR7495_c0_g1_i1.p1 gnl/Spiro4/13987_TR7495_c0_g1~~gnl/Spiro4/13987_TR7495_c0_g1_i1.p1  ORF type:complete len:647 (+),score=59.29 gnl/Spiro4/13987_TR7495_c0_g1_i1:110-1942(+)